MRRAIAPAFLASGLACAVALCGPAAADDLFLPFQAPDRPEALRYVLEFERKSKAGDWPAAVDKLQQLLDLPNTNSDLSQASPTTTWTGIPLPSIWPAKGFTACSAR